MLHTRTAQHTVRTRNHAHAHSQMHTCGCVRVRTHRYAIVEGQGMLKDLWCLQGCHKLLSQCKGKCTGRQAKRPRTEAQKNPLAFLLAKVGKRTEDVKCKWFACGRCHAATAEGKCAFLHDTSIEPALIECRRSNGKACSDPDTCLYYHEP